MRLKASQPESINPQTGRTKTLNIILGRPQKH
jgi:hypothetical protein